MTRSPVANWAARARPYRLMRPSSVDSRRTGTMERRAKLRKESRSERVQAYNKTYGHQIAVMGMFDKESRQVRAKVVPTVRREVLQKEILENIAWGSTLHTDEAVEYKSLKDKYVHETVNHAQEYVRGNVHTNSLENFWSLLKRNLRGTYVAVEPFHL